MGQSVSNSGVLIVREDTAIKGEIRNCRQLEVYGYVEGDIAAGKFALFHLAADGTVQAVEAVNASPEFMGGRRIIQRRKQLTAARISDLGVTMQELASA